MVQEIKLNQIDTVVTTVGTPGTDGNLPTEKAVRDAIIAAGIGGGGGGSDLLDIVTFTRVASAANGTVTYAHSAGVIPEYIMLQSSADTGDDRNTGSDGRGNLSVNGCTYWSFNDGGADTSTTHSVVLRTQVGPEEKASGVITAITSTTFDITWTLTGTPTGTTFNIVAYVYGPTGASASSKRGGDGADGAIDGTTNVTIAGSNDTYIVKNYSSIAAGVAPRILTITPTGCVLHIKVQGNADLTNWTFNFAGKGGQGGAAAVAIAGPGGVGGAMDNNPLKASGGSSDYAVGESTGGTLALTTNYYRAYPGNIFQLAYVGGAGGGGGAGSQTIANLTGNGGNGGGCVILEIAGNVTFNTTTFNMAGTDGAAGLNQGPGQKYWSGGGGGGGGGAFIYYQGTLTGAPTNTLTGGAGAASIAAAGATGTPGQPGAGGAGAGAAGGNSVGHIFAVGGDTGAGGVGGVGLAVLKKVNTF